MPKRGERHGPGNTGVGVVAVPGERVCHGLHPAGVGARCPMGHGDGVVRGRTHDHADLDGSGVGVPLAGPGALCRIWRLGPRGGGTPNPPADRTGTASPVGPRPSGGHRRYHVAPHQPAGLGDLYVPGAERPPSQSGGDGAGASLGAAGRPAARPAVDGLCRRRPAGMVARPSGPLARPFAPRPPWPWSCGGKPMWRRRRLSWGGVPAPMRCGPSGDRVCPPARGSDGSRS